MSMLPVSQGQTQAAAIPVPPPRAKGKVAALANGLNINPMAMRPGATRPQTQPKPSPTLAEQPASARNLNRDRPTMANRRRPTNGAQGTIAAMSPELKTEVVALSNLPSPPPSPLAVRQVQQMVQPNAMGHEEIVDADQTPALSNSTVIANDFVLVDDTVEEEKATVKKELESVEKETQEIISGLQTVGVDVSIDEDGFTLIPGNNDSLNMPTLEPVTPTGSVELDPISLEQIPLLSAVDASLPNVNPETDNQPAPAAPKGFWANVGDFFAAIGRFFLMCITCGAYGRSDRQ